MASQFHLSIPRTPIKSPKTQPIIPPILPNASGKSTQVSFSTDSSPLPTMSEIMEASKSQNLRLQLQTSGPFFRVKAASLEDERLELGSAVGLIRPWVDGKVLHLDSIRMTRATLGMERSIFGFGLFVGAVAVCHGYTCGCKRAELLAIHDSDVYHKKLVRFYTRMGFKTVREVDGSSMEDLSHMLVWGGKGTRMDADIKEIMLKWRKRFKQTSAT